MKKLILILLTGSLCSCGQNPTSSDVKTMVKDSVSVRKDSLVVKSPEKKIIIDTLNNDIARFVAGLKNESGKNFSSLEKKAEWVKYKTLFDSSWTVLETKRLKLMKDWAGTELAEVNKNTRTVLYPFSGPDFLNVNVFFPTGKNYIFMGLEPVGSVPDKKFLSDKGLNNYLASIYNSLNDLFKKSYFITRKMGKDMHNNEIDGTIPLLYMFMARTGNDIVSTKYIAVNKEGKITECEPSVAKNDSVMKRNRGVKIEFLPHGTDSVRTLYYFSVDVADDKLKRNPGFVKYLDSLGTVTSYVKSASYLMHYLTFSTIRNAVLNHSDYLLQDDSGIGYHFFDKKKWTLKLYGKYTKPIKDFHGQYEKDLAQAFEKDTSIKAIPFILGYNWGDRGINLLLASKKNQVSK